MSDNTQGFRPVANKLSVIPFPKEEKTAAGIIKVGEDDAPLKGTVLATGRGTPIVTGEGKYAIIPMEVQAGMTILFPPNVGLPLEVNGQKILLITDDHVLGIVD